MYVTKLHETTTYNPDNANLPPQRHLVLKLWVDEIALCIYVHVYFALQRSISSSWLYTIYSTL